MDDLKNVHIPVKALVQALLRCTVVVLAIGLLYAWLPLEDEHRWVSALVGALAVLGIVPLTGRRVRSVLVSERPVFEAVEALSDLLALLIFGFSAVYITINRNGDQFLGLSNRVDAVYFTVTTLSTVGFGDIVALGQTARIAVTIQILFDLTFVVVAGRVLVAVTGKRATNLR